MDFSLGTPINSNDNILNKKLFSLIKNNKMYGGGYIDNSNCITLIIGVVILIVGFLLCWIKNDWVEIKADVKNISCLNQNGNGNGNGNNVSNCDVSISYTVNSTQYSKMITLNKSDIPTNPYITIYYQESDPNIMRLYNFNYSVIGIILIVLSVFVIITSICCSTEILTPINVLESESNLYTNTRNADGVSVVYKK